MLVVAGENIPYVREVVSTVEGVDEVRIVRKGEMTAETVRDAELLLVRSTVQVNESMLAGTRVRFVATATIGTDHVDLDYLRSRGIEFASAPGSNARSVAEWVATALLVLESRGVVELEGTTLGVVGVGNVGTRVVEVAEALGMKTLLNDPPRARC
jgi:erythronate-4-phosphate dehydrogenase